VRQLSKSLVRRTMALAPVTAAVRWLNTHPRMSRDRREALYGRLTKHTPPPSGSLFSHPVPGGADLTLHPVGAATSLFWTGTYESETLALFTVYAARCRGVLDVGSAEGIYALFAAAVNRDARILAFEPATPQRRKAEANFAANPALVGDRVRLLPIALSDVDGTADFYEAGGNSSLRADFRSKAVIRKVAVARGDSVVSEFLPDTPIDLIKIDTEATEPAVIRGLAETIRRDRPTIFCEVLRGRTEPELQQFLADAGYTAYWLSSKGPIVRPRIDGDPAFRLVNWLFLPKGDQPLTAA